MRALLRVILVALLAYMFRSPLLRVQQTASHFVRFAPQTFVRQSSSTVPEDTMSRPNGTIATSGLELLTFGTPNGHKASIILEEIKEAYGKPDYV
jgi:glutathione S-transferase